MTIATTPRSTLIGLTVLALVLSVGCGADFVSKNEQTPVPGEQTTPTTPVVTTPTETTPADPLTQSPTGTVKVNVSYLGQQTLSNTEVVLLPTSSLTADCNTIDVNALPATALKRSVDAFPSTVTFDKLPVGLTYRVLALSRNDKGFAVASACAGDLVSPIKGYLHTVPLQLADIAKQFAGNYSVNYAVLLGNAMPDDVLLKLADLFGTLQNLGPQMAKWMCGTEPVIEDCKQALVETLLVEVNKIWVEDLSKGADTTTPQPFGSDTLRAILNSVVFHGRLSVTGKPDAAGQYTQTDNRLWLHSVDYVWDATCEEGNCPRQSLSGNAIGLDLAPLYISAGVVGDQLQLSQTKFGFELGRLLNLLIERHGLAAMFGNPQITSYEKLLLRIMGSEGCLEANNCCDAFVKKISEVIKDTSKAPAFCKSLSETAAATLRDKLLVINAYSPNVLTLGSFAAPSCRLSDADGNLSIDQIGSDEAPCMVSATISDKEQVLSVLTTLSATRD